MIGGRWARVVALAFMLLTLTGHAGARAAAQGSPAAGDAPLDVAVSFSILADLVANVGGEAVAVTVLVPAGSDAHTFEPSPDDIAVIERAEVLFENGLGFEPWLDDLYDASGSAAERVVVTDGLDLIEAGEGHADKGEGASPEAGDDHAAGEHDPHVWHDVANAIAMTGTIRDALTRVDPANSTTYAANTDVALASLADLDAFVVSQVAGLEEDRRRLVTSHDTFGY
ncbi:MAG: zinc ABC transporter substrate-binding protein, partial [Chloroflexia bacterium]|nr:zinc ABC transporter substrate-binding protein [Chloroflexia bacterium]